MPSVNQNGDMTDFFKNYFQGWMKKYDGMEIGMKSGQKAYLFLLNTVYFLTGFNQGMKESFGDGLFTI